MSPKLDPQGLELLKEAWEFPDYPGSAEGAVSDSEDVAAQEAWQEKREKLDLRIRAYLTATEKPREDE